MYDTDIAQYLHDAGVGVFNQAGANIFTHPVLPPSDYVPAKSVFIFAPTGGQQPSRMFDGAEIRYPAFTVRVRGNVNDYLDGQSFANTVYQTLESAKIAGYIDCKCSQSQPVWIGYTNEMPEWNINIELWIEKTY